MADNSVFITGAANGAFTEALSDLPPWATEHTAGQIEKHLRKNLNIQAQALRDLVRAAKGRSGTGMDADGAKKVNSELDKLLKNFKSVNTEESKKKKRDKEREVADKNNLLGAKEFSNKWQKAQFVLTSLAVIGSKVLNAEQQYIKTYNDLYKSGVNVLSGQKDGVTGMESLNQVVRLTGLRLETLQAVAEKYSTSINAIGFNKFAKTTGMAVKNMEALGYSSEETANMIGAYTDMQSNFIDMRRKSEEQLSDDVQKFAKQVTKTSLALGISRDKLLDNSKALSESTDMTTIQAQFGAKAAENVRAALMGLDPTVASKFMGLVADSGTGLGIMNSTVMDMIKSGSHYSTEMQQMGKDLTSMNPDEFNKKWSNLVNSPAWASEQKRLQLMGQAGVEGAKNTQQIMASMQNYSNRVSEATQSQVEGATKTKAVTSALATQQEKTAATMQAMFFPLESQIKSLTTAMELLNKATYGLADNTNSTARSWVGATLIVLGQIAGLAAAIGGVKTVLNLFGKSAGSVAEGAAAAGKSMSALGMLARGAGVVGAGVAGYEFGDAVVKPLVDSLVQSITGDKSASLGTAIYDMFNDDPMKAAGNSGKNAKITVPKTPAPSTINSPSAVPATPPSAPTDAGVKSTPASSPAGPGIDKSPSGIDINSTLTYQSNLLAEILEGTKSLVSVNKDILRYTRNQ